MAETQDTLDRHIEALLFAAQSALTVDEVRAAADLTFDQKWSAKQITEILASIQERYRSDDHVMQLTAIAGGYQFMTKPEYHRIIGDYLRLTEKKNLSKAALETLSIIAYKQPITKSGMESIRGVSCDYSVQKLLDRELVEIKGRDEGPGRPLLYGTTVKFLDHFGIQHTRELPNLKEFEAVENTIGEVQE